MTLKLHKIFTYFIKFQQVFYYFHLLYIVYWAVLVLHGPVFWYWFLVPGVIFVLEGIYRINASFGAHGHTYIEKGIILPSRVIHLVIKKPINFNYHPGDWIYVQIPEIAKAEWHPFTISSAPEMESSIWLHIRTVGEWTSRLYDYFKQQDAYLSEDWVKLGIDNPALVLNEERVSLSSVAGKVRKFSVKESGHEEAFLPQPSGKDDGSDKLFLQPISRNRLITAAANRMPFIIQSPFTPFNTPNRNNRNKKLSPLFGSGLSSNQDSFEEQGLTHNKTFLLNPPSVFGKHKEAGLYLTVGQDINQNLSTTPLTSSAIELTTLTSDARAFDSNNSKKEMRRHSSIEVNSAGKLSSISLSSSKSPEVRRHSDVTERKGVLRLASKIFVLPIPSDCDETGCGRARRPSRATEDLESGLLNSNVSGTRSKCNSPVSKFAAGIKEEQKDIMDRMLAGNVFKLQKPLHLYIDGPYGSPSSHIFHTEHAVLIATGIGVTPFASLLQSIMFRYIKARHSCPSCGHCWTDPIPPEAMNLRKVDFVWINRDQKSFEWFVNLLSELEITQAELGESERFLDMHMYITSALDKHDMKAVGLQLALDIMHEKEKRDLITGLKTRTKPGRPKWDQVFILLSS